MSDINFKNIVVLLGGKSDEREISLATGTAVAKALAKNKFKVDTLDWQGRTSIEQLLSNKYDCAFVALHGLDGEDGNIQGLLESIGMPYTGSGVLASALCMDKIKTKNVLYSNSLPVIRDVILSDDITDDYLVDNIGLPMCIKPVDQGSSVGVYKVNSKDKIASARKAVKDYGDVIMAETWLEGPEYTVGILDNKPLASIKIQPRQEFYDYNAKYLSKDTEYYCPSGLSKDKEQELQNLAIQAFNITGCKDWGRVDFVTDKNGDFYILEINTVPGLTNTSLLPKAAHQAGMSFEQLVLDIVKLASLHKKPGAPNMFTSSLTGGLLTGGNKC